MLKLNIDGAIHECPHGIDVNVWNSTLYGNRPFKGVVVSIYKMHLTPDGFNDTDTINGSLLSIDTDLDPEVWDDDWFGFNADTAPGDFPGDVFRFIKPFIEEIS